MKKTKALRDKIKLKYKKFTTFSELTGIDRYQMERDFLKRISVPDEVYEKYERLYQDTEATGYVVDDELIQTMRNGIEQAGGLFKFSEQAGLSHHTVGQVIAGKYRSISPAVKKIMEALGIPSKVAIILLIIMGSCLSQHKLVVGKRVHDPVKFTQGFAIRE